jgi:predicted ABC-class ATPase
MQTKDTLIAKLKAIDNKDYAAYQSILGEYDYKGFKLIIHQIPKDPYAPPHTGIYCIQVGHDKINLPGNMINSITRQKACRDYFARMFFYAAKKISKGRRGTGNSGIITIDEPGQAILERSSVIICKEYMEIRFFIGLPASGRNIESDIAGEMLSKELPEIVKQSLYKESIDMAGLKKHLETAEDAEYLRAQLEPLGLVAFIAHNAILPRKSGTSDEPLSKEETVPFSTPESLQVEIELPNAGKIKGMGIPRGVTLIVGGGYHGKSTLLNAIGLGFYNHIPGDGREQCVSDSGTVKIRSYSGRYVEKVDISTFIKNLPIKKDTTAFSTENASGSTSQAASILEAIEAGARVLLMDEDTCATNFMIRDLKMQSLVQKEDEPITTFIDKARQLYSEKDISTILVLGGAGDYFDVSDQVIQMIKYLPVDVTDKAREISRWFPLRRNQEDSGCPVSYKNRKPVPETIDPYNDYNKKSVYAKEVQRLNFGKNVIDLTDVEQLIELSQTRAIGQALCYIDKYIDGEKTLLEVINLLFHDLKNGGFDILSERISGHFAEFRSLELAFTLNRLRGIKMRQ